ncbi:MAG: DUF2304 domain-containing protein [Anaerolineae bacterium]|nr:DUF2304 domain-containing protein [Anaerolineae bacterium]
MLDRTMLVGVIGSIVALVFVLELVRERRLREEYSLLWLATGAVLLVLSLSRPLLDVLATAVGIFYPPSALFLVALLFVLAMLMHFSMVITRLTQENKENAQQIALLRHELSRLDSARHEAEDHEHRDQRNDVE